MNEPRKASDILLAIEAKLDQILAADRSQDLLFKLLTNKIGTVIDALNVLVKQDNSWQTKEVGIPSNQGNSITNFSNINTGATPETIVNDFNLTEETSPVGFRRTSRPETYENQNKVVAPTPAPKKIVLGQDPTQEQFPEYIPQTYSKPIPKPKAKKTESTTPHATMNAETVVDNGNKIPVSQRITDENGKSLFLADVEISGGNLTAPHNLRTNGVGKWQTSLSPGYYQVKIKKFESLTKKKIDVVQDITIDGKKKVEELRPFIARPSN
jgi:hypothetical protein